VYKEYGLEKWEIQTIIWGREEDPKDPTMDYTNAYVDWSYSVEIAMQGAIACMSWYFEDSSHGDGLTEGLGGVQRWVRLDIG
jgi:hypothetical protein